MRSCLSREEERGLSSGRKAKVIQRAGEEKFIPWAGVELGRKVYPEGLQSSGSGWRARSRAQCSPSPKLCPAGPSRGSWAGPVCRRTIAHCAALSHGAVLPEEPIKL